MPQKLTHTKQQMCNLKEQWPFKKTYRKPYQQEQHKRWSLKNEFLGTRINSPKINMEEQTQRNIRENL